MKDETLIIRAGRHPHDNHGAVNPPVYHASTILADSLADYEQKSRERVADKPGTYYGRFGTPTTLALEEAVAALEGGYKAHVYPSGLAACSGALLAFLSAGDNVLMTDSVYGPTRSLANGLLKRFGVSTTFYDPLIGAGIEALIQPNTKVIYLESPGSLTFEVQDVPAITGVAHRRGVTTIIDNTWGTPFYFKPFEHGVDVSVQAATKYIVGHSDAMLGIVTANKEHWLRLRATTNELGQSAGPDDVYLAQRGLRTMAVRLKQHWQTGVQLAEWIARQPEVQRVLHPALPGDPGHALWRRDVRGACGLFGVVLKPVKHEAFAAMIDGLELYGIGASWGGYESLAVPTTGFITRTAGSGQFAGPVVRLHIGLEDVDDLLADLDQGLAVMRRFGK